MISKSLRIIGNKTIQRQIHHIDPAPWLLHLRCIAWLHQFSFMPAPKPQGLQNTLDFEQRFDILCAIIKTFFAAFNCKTFFCDG
jgi:transcriptional regulator of met regulon